MVLLRGLNYDFSGQQWTTLSSAASAAETTLTVTNTTGFADDDYVLIEPYTEKSEIVRINDTVSSDTSLTITALKFSHASDVKIFRLPYNKMKFYECETETGTYTVIAGATVDLSYDSTYTNYDYPAGDDDYYFKRTFYNETTTVESDIGLSNPWQADDEQYYITEEELRVWLQFGENDYPNRDDMRKFIKIAQMKVDLDVSSSNTNIKKIAMLHLAKYYVLRGLATKSVSKGYVTVNAEGRTVTKAYQELVLEAENVIQEYNIFLRENLTSEVSRTDFMDDSTAVDGYTRTKINDIMTGLQNAMDFEDSHRVIYGRRTRF